MTGDLNLKISIFTSCRFIEISTCKSNSKVKPFMKQDIAAMTAAFDVRVPAFGGKEKIKCHIPLYGLDILSLSSA